MVLVGNAMNRHVQTESVDPAGQSTPDSRS